jgi:RNA polymerase sigma-70 factor (ECF subfamily)
MIMMDIQTFQIQVIPLREKVFRMSLRMLRCADDAEDTAQDVMLKLWMMRDRLPVYREVEALAVQICKNININKIKARKNTSEDAFKTMQEPSPAPDRQLETSDTMATVARIIDRLPDLQRMVIRLRDIEGYHTAEIARIMGCEENAVNVNLFRARKKVREEFFKINNFSLL